MFGLPGGIGLAAAGGGGSFPPLSPNTMSVGFAGSNQYANLGSLSYDWDGTSGAGMVWARIDRTNVYQCVTGQGYSATAHIGIFVGITDAGAPYLYLGGVSTSGANGTIVAGNWYMFSWSFTGGVGKFYVNGVQQGTNITIGTESAAADWLVMATRYNDGDNSGEGFPTQGLVNNMALWNVAITQADMVRLYNGGTPVAPTNISGCTHWWKFGDDAGDYVGSSYLINDAVGSNDATLTNFSGGGAPWLMTPAGGTVTYSYLPTNVFSCLYQFRASNFAAATDWTASFGSFTATYIDGGGSSVQQNSGFSGIKEATVGDKFIMATSNTHGLSSSTVRTFAWVFKPGALDGSGGFYAGTDDDGTGKAHVRLFNYFYAKDVGVWVYNTADTQFEISGLNAVHANQYVIVHVVIDIPNSIARSYVNGTLINSVALSGTFTLASVKFGLMSVGKEGVGVDYESTANGQTFIEFTRYDAALTHKEIAAQAAAFNVIKGYF